MSTSKSVAEADRQWLRVLSTLNEAQARLFVAQRALEIGRGGISEIARLTGMSRPTITKGVAELKANKPLAPDGGRVRRAGGGRKRVEEIDPQLKKRLTKILAETTAGDPMSQLKWTGKSTRALADELTRQGHAVSSVTVARCLHEMGYSLQANFKTIEGKQHPDRDEQFRYINRQVKSFLKSKDPVISVDTKKKELVGDFANSGTTWRPKGKPQPVNVHDFPHLGHGKAVPYGAYDIGEDRALVNVGVSHDTGEFAVESIRRWWRLLGRKSYPRARRLLICADAGGSNGTRLRLWKFSLQRFVNRTGLPITVCHYPPGTSKWNKIEHRLFSFISLNWKGQALVSFEAVVQLIGNTRTKSGLKVKALLDERDYEKGKKVTDEQFETIRLKGHRFHPDWNYTLQPST